MPGFSLIEGGGVHLLRLSGCALTQGGTRQNPLSSWRVLPALRVPATQAVETFGPHRRVVALQAAHALWPVVCWCLVASGGFLGVSWVGQCAACGKAHSALACLS